MNFSELLHFEKMITPNLVNILYWLLLLVVLFSGLAQIFFSGSLTGFIAGILTIIVGGIVARVWCELLIVLFKIHGNLQVIQDRGQNDV